MTNRLADRQGFSLIELSVVLVIIASLTGGGLAMLMASFERQSYRITQERLDVLQKYITLFAQKKGYLPCPGDITASIQAAGYGTGTGSGAAAADCSVATFTSGNTVAGMVPTKTLGLKDVDAIDGWGMRILYAVDERLTVDPALVQYEQYDTSIGSITVNDEQGSTRTTQAAYLLLSHGENSHGAYPAAGGSTRKGGYVTHTDELENCDCSSSGASGAFDGVFVQQLIKGSGDDDSYDDDVRYVVYKDLNT